MYALAPVLTYADRCERSIRCAVHAHGRVHGRASVLYRRRERGIRAAGPGERQRNERRREARVASPGWVSHSLSMRVGLATRTPRRGNRLQLSEHAWPNVGARNTTVGAFELLQPEIGFSLLSPSLLLSLSCPGSLWRILLALLCFACRRWAGLTVH